MRWSCLTHTDFTYLGYSLEPPAKEMKVIPFNQRPYRVYVLAKRLHYFYEWRAPATTPRDQFARAAKELAEEFPGFEFVGAVRDDRSPQDMEQSGEMSLPEGIKNMYPLDADQWDAEVAQARLLMGIGWPTLSPSPYRALAMVSSWSFPKAAARVVTLIPQRVFPSSTPWNTTNKVVGCSVNTRF